MLQEAAENNRLAERGIVTMAQVYLAGNYAVYLDRVIKLQKMEVLKAEENVEEAKDAYLEAAKDAEALVTLKEKRRAEYMEYFYKEEGKFMDELTTNKGNTFRKNEEQL